MKKKLFLSVALLTTALIATSCNGQTPSSEPSSEQQVNIEGIAISSLNDVRTIKVEETLQLTAKVYPLTASQNVTWTTSDSTVATVDANGLVTAVKAGNVNVIATSTVDTTISQTFALIVEEKEAEVILPESLSLSTLGNVTTFKAGETLELTAVVYPTEASQSVDWTSSDETIATVSRGVVTGLKEGSVTITATSKELSSVTASITLTIEKGDDPVLTKDWPNMSYSSHETYMTADDETPLKVKGVVTYVTPASAEGYVNYYIQNGTDGYYVYNQSNITSPVEVGKVYEVGGFKKYYRGLNEIVNIEYFKQLDEALTYTVTSVNDKNPSDRDAMSPYHCSYISGDATIVSVPSISTKAYSVDVKINGYDTVLRVDPASMTADEFSTISASFTQAVEGSVVEFKGIMSAFGYGTPSNQIQIVKSTDLTFAAVTNSDLVNAATNVLAIAGSVNTQTTSITLPTTFADYAGVSVSWVSNSPLVDVTTGNVTHGETDTVVTLTATISLGDAVATKEFKVNVFGTTEYETVASLDLEDALPAESYGNSASKSGYAEGNVNLGGNTWMLRNALISSTASDKFDGTFAIRVQGNANEAQTGRVEILSAGEYNYVQFDACVYGNDPVGIQLGIAYTDENGNWVDSGTIITLTNKTLETFRVVLPEGNKRVAIYVVAGSGKRVNLDNIKLMK